MKIFDKIKSLFKPRYLVKTEYIEEPMTPARGYVDKLLHEMCANSDFYRILKKETFAGNGDLAFRDIIDRFSNMMNYGNSEFFTLRIGDKEFHVSVEVSEDADRVAINIK